MPLFEAEATIFHKRDLPFATDGIIHRISFSLDVWKSLNGLKSTPKMREDGSNSTNF